MPDIYSLILNIDEQLLLFINGLHTPFLDTIMWQFSGRYFWLPLYMVLLILLFRKVGIKKGVVCVILLSLMIFSADQLCSSVIRPVIGRLRPSSPLNPISSLLHFVNDSRGGIYGFPSCHAANSFAIVSFLSLLLNRRWFTIALFSWALLVSLSRIYLGFHYPTDIIAGAFLGICIGYTFYNFFKILTSLRFFAPVNNYFAEDI